MIRAVVGAGGKTTYIRNKVKDFLADGKKVFVTTSTHMYIDKDTILSDNPEEIINELETKNYVMAGLSDGGKLSPLSYETYLKVCEYADEVLIEADGSKHFPLKFPNDREPVIYENVEEIVVISGDHGVWKSVADAMHRCELSEQFGINMNKDTIITPELRMKIVQLAYLKRLEKKYPFMRVIHEPNGALGVKIGCIIMASGSSKRFGSNKLFAKIDDQTFIERILQITKGLFDRVLVLTRTPEIGQLCNQFSAEYLIHDKEYRNESIKLGMEKMMDMDACMFCVCDQPFLERESFIRMNCKFDESREGILQLSYEENIGSPVLFSKEYFEELKKLPEKKGGSYLLKSYPDKISYVQATSSKELIDIDTLDAYNRYCKE